MIEAVNENRADCFGWAVEEVLEERGLRRLRPNGCVHHHGNKSNLVGKGRAVDGRLSLLGNVMFQAIDCAIYRKTLTECQDGLKGRAKF